MPLPPVRRGMGQAHGRPAEALRAMQDAVLERPSWQTAYGQAGEGKEGSEVTKRGWLLLIAALAVMVAGAGGMLWSVAVELRTLEGRKIAVACFGFGWLLWRLGTLEGLLRENQREIKGMRIAAERREEQEERRRDREFKAKLERASSMDPGGEARGADQELLGRR